VIVLGIDPGTATTGYALVSEDTAGDADLLRYGVFQTQAGVPMPERLRSLYDGVMALITESGPNALAIEELFFSRNVTTALSVGQARGVILLAAAQAGLEIYEYKPAVVKQAVVGYGGAKKQQIQEMLRIMLGLADIPKPDDAADAIAVAVCHIHSVRLRNLMANESL
jgi:crossover junction endodeoxyribonuclease RuvC